MRKPVIISIVGVAAIAVAATAFALTNASTPAGEPKPAPTTTVTDVTAEKEPVAIVVAPGGEVPMLNGDNLPEAHETLTTLEHDETDAAHNPENKPVTAAGTRPEGVQFPTTGKFMDGATKFDADNSHVAILFSADWKSVVTDVKETMEASGFTCRTCIPFVPGPEDKKLLAPVKYILQMSDKTREVSILVSEQPGGTLASYTFQG